MRFESKVIAATVISLCVLIPRGVAASLDLDCHIPPNLQHEIDKKYPTAKLVSTSDLEDTDRKLFQGDHGDACPGLVKVDFYGDRKPTLALVLVLKSGGNERTELIVARYTPEGWKVTPLDTGGPSPYAPVVWTQPPGEYLDVHGQTKIRATRPVIVFCKYESWAILYAWTGNKVSKIWLSD